MILLSSSSPAVYTSRLFQFLIPAFFSVLFIAGPAILIKFGFIDVYFAQIITVAGINAMLAISVNFITGFAGQLSLGQAGFMAIGAYACITFNVDLNAPLPLAALFAGIVASLAAFLIGFPALKLTGDYLAIVTLGFGEIIRVVLTNLRSITGGANGRQFVSVLAVNPTSAFITVTATLIATLALFQNFNRSSYGRAILALRDDEIAANSCGISIFRYKMIAFVSAGFIAGISGALYAMVIGFVKPDMASFTKSIDCLIFVVLGGMGSITGSIVAAYVLTALQEVLRFLKDYRLLFYPVILIFVMLFRPQGLLGMSEFSFVGFCKYCSRKINNAVKTRQTLKKSGKKNVK
ncbi:MAG: branched-chain amino acid ABC transporter permease [Spirochaetaceae bacterium]|jgi:branched-chain amino acid transport system permease protein|nr:branched-chain amino acid ABC transporter permease [Spirochaetaceae bacterium]